MTDENKFFRFVWRFNALVLAVVVLGALFLVIAASWFQFGVTHHWGEPVGQFAPVPENAAKKFTYRLAAESSSNWIEERQRFVLRRWKVDQGEKGLEISSYGGRRGQDVNYLFVDSDTGASQWVFRGYDRIIVANDAICEAAATPENTSLAVAMVITAVESDTNKDGELSEEDRKIMYGYRLGSAAPVKMLPVDVVLGSQQIGSDRYMVAYEIDKAAKVAIFSTKDFKLISERPISNVPN